MDNVIPPMTPPSMIPPVVDKGVVGIITTLPEVPLVIKTGESLLLKVMMEAGAFKVAFNSEAKDVVLNMKTELPLELVAGREYDVAARVVSNVGDKLQVQLLTIDNNKAEAFVAPKAVVENKIVSSFQSVDAKLPPKIADVAIVKELNNAQEQVKFLPLKLAPLVENMLKDVNLNPTIKQHVMNAVANIELKIDFKTILPAPLTHNQPLDKVLNQMEQTLQSMAQYQNKPEVLTALINKFTAQIDGLKDMPLAATYSLKGEANVPVMDTVLGKVLLETTVKLKTDTSVMLQIKDIISAAIKPLVDREVQSQPLNDLISKFIDVSKFQKLFTQLENLNPLQFIRENKEIKPTTDLAAVLKIIEPLKNQPQHLDVALKILEKFPAFNEKILSNTLSFVKAAETNNPSIWLGEEIIAELKTFGTEGKEVLSRLNNFVATTNKETPAWRMVEVPFFNGDSISKVKIALKKPEEDEEEAKKQNRYKFGTRFVVETNFTRLGTFQFDGFSLAQDRRFDLIIRTSNDIPKDLCAQIMNLFKNSLHEVNYVGNININVKDTFIKIYEDDAPENHLKKGVYI